jgi:general secretion pathway protein E
MDTKVKFETPKKDVAQPIGKPAEDRGSIQEVDEVLAAAVTQGAKEVHFEPLADKLVVRQRVKEGLVVVKEIEERLKVQVVNRVKVLSGMDITRSKMPQVGYFKITVDDNPIEVNSAVCPGLYGEKLVVKFQYRREVQFRLDALGFSSKVLPLFKRAVERPNGLILFSGPPGSGKRTTAYTCISHLASAQKLLLAMDSVIKYEIPGMVQMKHDDKSEYSLGEGARGMMEQEPDVCFIGEMTDPEVARLAVQGGFAKRIVFARMSANNSINAVQSLIDMGVPPFLVTGAVIASLNQRLVRRLCQACKQPYEPPTSLMVEIGVRFLPGAPLYKPGGCPQCEGTGFRGQIAFFELYIPNEELSEMFMSRTQVKEIMRRAAEISLIPLKFDGAQKAASGLVTIEDVLNAI